MAGRPKTADPGVSHTVRYPDTMDAYLELFMPGGERSAYLREAIEFLQRMRPAAVVRGELQFVQHERKAPRPLYSKPRKALTEYAAAHGLTVKDAEAKLLREVLKK